MNRLVLLALAFVLGIGALVAFWPDRGPAATPTVAEAADPAAPQPDPAAPAAPALTPTPAVPTPSVAPQAAPRVVRPAARAPRTVPPSLLAELSSDEDDDEGRGRSPEGRDKDSDGEELDEERFGEDERFDEPHHFIEYHEAIRTVLGEDELSYGPNYRMEAVKALEAAGEAPLGKTGVAPTFTERGPGNVSGRTRTIVPDVAAPTTTWYVGSAGGGIWKTSDAGGSWTNLTPNLPNLAISTLVQAASQPDVMYAGSGEGFGNADAIKGDGIFKSFDRGVTWAQITSTTRFNGFDAVNRMIVSPTDADTVLAATNVGVFRSTDGGFSWTQTYTPSPTVNGRVQQIVADPRAFNVQYATVNGLGVIKSTDAGATWATASNGFFPGSRFEIALWSKNPDVLYASVETSSTVTDVYVSLDGAGSWSLLTQSAAPNILNGQGWYDNAVAVNPLDSAIAYVGGVDIYRINANFAAGSQETRLVSVARPSWLAPVNYTGVISNGIAYGYVAYGGPNDLTAADLVDVQIRFGPTAGCTNNPCSQLAHKFTPGANTTFATVPYTGYVSVPFEVWDVTNNRPLAASFWDQDNSGAWNLSTATSGAGSAEYLFVHSFTYDPAAPTPQVAVAGGERVKNPYFGWYRLASGTWNPATLPASQIVIDAETRATFARTSTRVSQWNAAITSPSYAHADHHALVFVPTGPNAFRLLNGNDGGVAYSDNYTATWNQTLNGYNTTQPYSADKRAGEDRYITGFQDNGTWMSPEAVTAGPTTAYTSELGGDGFGTAWHRENPNLLVGSIQYTDVRRSTNGGGTWVTARPTETGSGAGGMFITEIEKADADPDLLFTTGVTGPHRTDNFAASWTKSTLTAPATWYTASQLRSIVAVSRTDNRYVWAVSAITASHRPQRSTDGGLTFSPTAGYPTGMSAFASGLATHPTDRNTAYIMFSIGGLPKIFGTTDGGATWTSLTGTFATATSPLSSNGFPNVATYSLLVMPYDPNVMWAGTEIGLVVSTDAGATWNMAGFDLPATAIWEQRIVDDQVVFSTHGRGVWTATVPELAAVSAPVATRTPRLDGAGQAATGALSLQISRRSAYDSLVVRRNGTKIAVFGPNAAPTAGETVTVPVTTTGTVTVDLIAYVGGEPYQSSSRSVTLRALSPTVTYVNNFDANSTGLTVSGTATNFTRTTPAGFTTPAMHTPHLYANNANYTLTLDSPVIVAQSGATIVFDEIALAEPCNDGTDECNAGGFYDYATVEATKDGFTWVPLAGPYDARADAAWLARWNASFDASGNSTGAGDPSLYRTRTIDLLTASAAAGFTSRSDGSVRGAAVTEDGKGAGLPLAASRSAAPSFMAGDTIFVRFRFAADGGIRGWGWAIDNLRVQENAVVPVELATFEGAYDAGRVRLAWATASETNNAAFAVERASGDGAAATWTEVGRVEGSGTTSEARRYAFSDPDVPFTAARVRYRLRQIDLDGTAHVSAELEVAVGMPTKFAVHEPAPNPLRTTARLRYELPTAEDVRIELFDLSGRLVGRLVDERRDAGRYEVPLSAGTLAAGRYFVRVQAGQHLATKPFTVVR